MRLQPITRKERFLYEIVGWGETAPKNELTTEELFFAKILGRNVILPDLSNVPRYYLLLAKIAGENVNVTPPTYVSPPLEFFLAKAAGMDVEAPIPRTREEIFWAAYTGAEIEGVPPLTFTAKTGTLSNYRIYGNTVDGEGVGDRTVNLFDSNINVISGYLSDEGILTPATELGQMTFDYIPIISGTYTFTYTVPSAYNLWIGVCTYDESRTFQSRLVSEYSGLEYSCDATFTIPDTTKYIRISLRGFNKTPIIMLNEGSTPFPYEPYGYRVPVTVNDIITNLYLPEPLKMVGDEAEYIDFMEQKQHFADGTSADVTLPAIPTLSGTNMLSVGTEVQPSNVYIKYEGAR